jgi:rhodanese-related sulfurtransferase
MRKIAMKKLLALVAFVVGSAAALTNVQAATEPSKSEFPYRSQYLDVAIMETADLNKRFNDVIVVDVRSAYEYQTLRIKDSTNVPVGTRTFLDEIRKLRERSNKPIVFYCNGKTCRKSYDAVLAAQSARIADTYAYDAGVFDWAKAHPERAVLLNKSPVKPEDLITEQAYKDRIIDPKDFAARVGQNSLVLDVRDRVQRDSALFPFKETRAQLSETDKIDAAIDQALKGNKALLVYDAAGHQVRWFQYYLESKGVRDYYFMKNGAQGYFDATLGKVSLGQDTKKK